MLAVSLDRGRAAHINSPGKPNRGIYMCDIPTTETIAGDFLIAGDGPLAPHTFSHVRVAVKSSPAPSPTVSQISIATLTDAFAFGVARF